MQVEEITQVELRHPFFLVQRLLPPTKKQFFNPYSFGGGLPLGGLHPEVMQELSKIFAFDYMGRGEFEFGALPQAMGKMFKLSMDGRLGGWAEKLSGKTILVIADRRYRSVIKDALQGLINDTVRSKERLFFREALGICDCAKDKAVFARKTNEIHAPWCLVGNPSDRPTKGWLDEEHGIFFTIDEGMFQGMLHFFERNNLEALIDKIRPTVKNKSFNETLEPWGTSWGGR